MVPDITMLHYRLVVFNMAHVNYVFIIALWLFSVIYFSEPPLSTEGSGCQLALSPPRWAATPRDPPPNTHAHRSASANSARGRSSQRSRVYEPSFNAAFHRHREARESRTKSLTSPNVNETTTGPANKAVHRHGAETDHQLWRRACKTAPIRKFLFHFPL